MLTLSNPFPPCPLSSLILPCPHVQLLQLHPLHLLFPEPARNLGLPSWLLPGFLPGMPFPHCVHLSQIPGSDGGRERDSLEWVMWVQQPRSNPNVGKVTQLLRTSVSQLIWGFVWIIFNISFLSSTNHLPWIVITLNCNLVFKSINSGARDKQLGFKSQFCQLLAVWPWISS